ncbi:hypothetical protein [Paenibacillus sp. RC84]|uniref:hypothetical protein n=1 Tax=Paenibacillus sp. RC84 TaxID=3156252 RepID=UPI0035181DFD
MNAWWNLFKKEIGMRTAVTGSQKTWAAFSVGMIALMTFMAYRYQSGIVTPLWLGIIYLHVFLPSVYLLISFGKERERAPLWFQLPQSGWKLIGAKYAAALTEMIGGLLVSITMFLWMYKVEQMTLIERAGEDPFYLSGHVSYFTGLLHGLGFKEVFIFFFIAFFIAALAVLVYFTALALSNRVGRLRWLAAIILIGAVMLVEYTFEMSPVYHFLFKWGYAFDWDGDPFYSGEMIWTLATLAVVVYIPAWLLDRKVEV